VVWNVPGPGANLFARASCWPGIASGGNDIFVFCLLEFNHEIRDMDGWEDEFDIWQARI
jgi:hypothetical protein